MAGSQRCPFVRMHGMERCGFGPRHRRCYPPLFFRCELEDVVSEQLSMVSIIAVKTRRRWPGEDPPIVVLLEQTGRHGSAGADSLRIGDPPFDPIGFQPFLCQQEVRSGRNLIVRSIARCVALQAWCGCAREKAPRHVTFFRSEDWNLLRNIRQRLLRQRFEEPHKLSEFIV